MEGGYGSFTQPKLKPLPVHGNAHPWQAGEIHARSNAVGFNVERAIQPHIVG